MTQTEALRLALEALEFDSFYGTSKQEAITAIKAALLSRSDGEAQTRSVDKDEPWTLDDTAYRPNGLPQEFIKHEVESPDDWSEWVCPNPDEYFMKCCDCGLVHEVQYRVARYGEGDYCELVEDKDVQAQFRMRRRTPPNPEVKNEKPWVCECGADSYNACKCVFKAALEAKDEPVGKFAKFTDGIWREVTNGSAGVPLYAAPPQQEANDEIVACGACNGSGRMVRDPDIGTDQECFVCEGALEAKDEPVCDKDPQGCWSVRCQLGKQCKNTPPQRTWVGLTDEEIVLIVAECAASHQHTDIHFARAIETKLRSKNHDS